MKLVLKNGVQENEYYYKGTMPLIQLADLCRAYDFSEDVLEKARIHRRNMEQGLLSVTVRLRVDPEADIDWKEDCLVIDTQEFDIRDGKSKAAALTGLEEELLKGQEANVKIFRLSQEKMRKVEENRL